jgi:hypothetical protein
MVKLGFVLDTMDWINKIPVRTVEAFTTDSHPLYPHPSSSFLLGHVATRLSYRYNRTYMYWHVFKRRRWTLCFMHARIERDYLPFAKMSSRWTTATTITASLFDIIIAFQARQRHLPLFFLAYHFNWYLFIVIWQFLWQSFFIKYKFKKGL